jgi:hypothetical protein
MTVSYHELTHNQPRDTADQRKQYLVICVIGAAFFFNSLLTSGLLEPVRINDGIYPGGFFVYKKLERDYASTGGSFRRVTEDLHNSITQDNKIKKDSYSNDIYQAYEPYLHAVYVDNLEYQVPSGTERYFSGILIDKSQIAWQNALMDLNKSIIAPNPSPNNNEKKEKKDEERLSFSEMFSSTKYEIADLPSLRASVAVFPYTNGFVSALLHQYKVFPALVKHAQQYHPKGNTIVISTSCDTINKLCTHYVPMVQGSEFLMGHIDSRDYASNRKFKSYMDYLDPKPFFIGFKSLFVTKNDEL